MRALIRGAESLSPLFVRVRGAFPAAGQGRSAGPGGAGDAVAGQGPSRSPSSLPGVAPERRDVYAGLGARLAASTEQLIVYRPVFDKPELITPLN